MNIRTATIKDLEAVTSVEAECFPPAEAATREELAERLKYYAEHFWLMFDGDKLIAFVDGFVTDEEDLTDEMYAKAQLHNENGAWQMIFGVNTIPAYRKHGYAGELIKCAIEDARKKKDAAKKKLEKTVETLTTSNTLTPEQRVQKEIQNKFEKKNVSSATQKAEKKETEIVGQNEEKKSKYFTDNLSKLDKSKRKLVGQIMGIVSQIAPENIAEEIQAAIEKEFR